MAKPLIPFRSTEEELIAFLDGDCGFLAAALHERFGYELVVVGDTNKRISHRKRPWKHFGVRTGEGHLIDICGVWDDEDMFLEWWRGEDDPDTFGVLPIRMKDFPKYQDYERRFEDVSLPETVERIAEQLEEFATLIV